MLYMFKNNMQKVTINDNFLFKVKLDWIISLFILLSLHALPFVTKARVIR